MRTKTKIVDDLESAELREKYDTQCKILLSEKPILARIMQGCMSEYKDCSIEQIESYIEGKPAISTFSLYPSGKTIRGMNTEDGSINEGTIYYDIRFTALAPSTKEQIELIINIEAQNKYNPGYPLVKRGLYYAARLISSQFGVEFEKQDYAKLKKVYSIWICMNPPKSVRNTIIEFNLGINIITGAEKQKAIEQVFKKKNYDLLSVIFVNLDKDGGGASHLLELLNLLFLKETDAIEKCKILEREFGIEMLQEMQKEVEEMCDLSLGVMERGYIKGMQQGIAQGMQQGIAQGTNRLLQLNRQLLQTGRTNDLLKASSDSDYLNKLFLEFGL